MPFVHQTKDELQKEFEAAKQGIDKTVVNNVMKGIPFNGDNTPDVRALKSAWTKYREILRY